MIEKQKTNPIESKGDKLVYTTWRPLDYKSVEQMEDKIKEYFNETEIGKLTITWLSLYLGFSSRQSLLNYQWKPQFLDTIKKAKQMIEHSYELDLKEKWNSGTIFALKNFDWKDKSEVENTWTSENAKAEVIKKLWDKIDSMNPDDLNIAINDLLN